LKTSKHFTTVPLADLRGQFAVVAIVAVLLLSGCADHFAVTVAHEPVGFWYGLWHGMILPVAWVVSWFSDDVAIYAVYNNGGWYNFGFVLGTGALGGSAK